MFEAMERFGAVILTTRSSINPIRDKMMKNVLFENILLKNVQSVSLPHHNTS